MYKIGILSNCSSFTQRKTYFYPLYFNFTRFLYDFSRYEKRPDNHPLYEFESMSIYEYTMLFEAYYKKTSNINDGDDDKNGALEDDNEPKDISNQTSC
jgi:hypothetical protein